MSHDIQKGRLVTEPIESAPEPPSLAAVRAMGRAAGLDIDDDRLPAVQTVLAELLGLSTTLSHFDLEGIEPDTGDPRADWEERR